MYYYFFRELSVLTFPYTMNKITYTLLQNEAKKEIIVNKDIAIVTTLQDESHILLQQLTNNNILFYQTTNDELLNTLNKINKKYVLIITSPAIIVGDLNTNFIEHFEALNDKFVFGGTIHNPIGVDYLGSDELSMGVYKYLDDSVMFGVTSEVKKYYSKYIRYKDDKLMSNVATLVKYYREPNGLNEYIDSYGSIFCCVDFNNVQIREDEENRYIEYVDNEERRLF